MLHTYMQLGGPIMWPLALCSAALVAVLLERAWTVGVVHLVMGRASVEALRWHRRVLPFFVDVPPSVGLLGTVVGVVQSFHLVDGRIDGAMVGAGLGVACMTTIFGLGIGIAASASLHLLDWLTGYDGSQGGGSGASAGVSSASGGMRQGD